jgi:hypothetical protein
VTEKNEGMLFPQTMSVFRCTNQICQEEKDKQTDKRIKFFKDKELSNKIRAEKKVEEKRALELMKLNKQN